jgi:ribonuclease HII
VTEVNVLGINNATFKCMHKCLDDLTINQIISYWMVPFDNVGDYKVELVPKGDDTHLQFAAAAIVAKA